MVHFELKCSELTLLPYIVPTTAFWAEFAFYKDVFLDFIYFVRSPTAVVLGRLFSFFFDPYL